MAMVSKTRNMLEGLVREGSFKWLLSGRSSFDEDFEESSKPPSARSNWIPQLSPIANTTVCRCSRILGISTSHIQDNFDGEASDSIKHPSQYARNLLEYCCFRALALCTQVVGHLADRKFRRLTYDMMLAWEAPAASSQPLLTVDEDATVGIEAFSRIAPAVPVIANVIISDNLFEMLTASTGGRLYFSVYEKYLTALERAIKKFRTQSELPLLASLRSSSREKILEVDGTVTTQPVLQHVGISTWPGRLTLTDQALYFEALRLVSYDKAKRYDLSDDVKQVVKPELTGPWGTRLFDRAVSYKSISLSEPVVIEFPELKGHTRRDYWLAIIQEVLYLHRFIRKFKIEGAERIDILSKAVLGILRLQAIQEICSSVSFDSKALLMFSLCDRLPGGDLILETLVGMSTSRESDRTNNSPDGMCSMSALAMVSNLGFLLGTSSSVPNEAGLLVGEIAVGDITQLQRAVKESQRSYKKVVLAQATVNEVKVDGIDTNLAVMKELLFPVMELGKWLLDLAYWDDPVKSVVFCTVLTYIICRGWLHYAFAVVLVFIPIFMVLTRFCNQGRPLVELQVIAPPPMTKMDQLLAVQNAISRVEVLLQDGNITLLKLRALLLSIFPQVPPNTCPVLI
ncbi:uncharacterized protein LOC131146351 isoform X2 [Malania oleifera]|uniref:uncharacterized protein LOC131146351 isoform X2 n=1 Tax=Malania oleifera TaxID=397392 RepID=UPI0025ADFFCC|nr:uncharacterized protein LOC131146351 isoform X2 [Malania oleifera]XP_057951908.1 uncharacterized protein LOC131146351 isoform X2 [Malania oleifera]XP_057951909.1 uncharacterized protein LOC131146351 isoform X2 [Malania oleifera]